MAAVDVVIMAAGKGTRMKSAQSKVLQKIAGKPLLLHVLATAQALHAAQAVVITGHQAESVEAATTQALSGGALPINPSGGLKAKGHPIGATGVSMHVLAAMQLAGEAGAMQVPGANLGGVFNMGGAAVASYVSVLERAK